ncbi:Trm112 family protein [Streptomyces sp. NPDC003691]
MNADDPLLAILVCPLDKGPLLLVNSTAPSSTTAPSDGDALYNPRLRRLYPIVNRVPQLRPASGMPVSDEDHARLTGPAGPTGPNDSAPTSGSGSRRS